MNKSRELFSPEGTQINAEMQIRGECGGVFKPGDVIPEGTPINTIRGK